MKRNGSAANPAPHARHRRRMAILAASAAAALLLAGASPTPFSPALCRERRRALSELAGPGILLVRGAPDTELGDFHPAKDLLYLTGVRTPDAALVVVLPDPHVRPEEPEGEPDTERADPRSILFLPEKNEGWERWNGPRLAPGEDAQARTGIEETLETTRLPATLHELLATSPPLLLDLDRGSDRPAIPADRELVAALREDLPDLELRSSRRVLSALRRVKSPEEIAAIEEAVRVTIQAHREAARLVAPGVAEYELEGVIEGTFRRLGAWGPAFASIVGSGPNSCILHWRRNDRTMAAGEVVLIDVGAEVDGYAADLTRTYPVSGSFTPEQRAIVEAVLEAQRAGIAAVRPGATLRDVHRAARDVLQRRGLAKHFWHGTSHFLGLDVHDGGPAGEPLEPGMVVTVEPGAYLPERGIGVRIEDDVLVTPDGRRVLSEALPRSIEGLEAWVRGSPR